jgi:hypothetical protein
VIPGSYGLFDLAGPALRWLDALLPLPALVRVLVWAAVGSAGSMALYALLSPQRRLAAVKLAISEAQAGVDAYAGDFRGALPLLKRQIGLSLRHVGLTLVPAVVGSLPVLFLLPFLALRFGWTPPEPGTPVAVTVRPARGDLRWLPPQTPGTAAGSWQVPWPAPERPVTLQSAAGLTLLRLPPEQLAPAFAKRRWWHWFFGERAGYLPGDAPVEVVELGLSRRALVPGAPRWLSGWELPFFLGMLVFSVGIKLRFKLH